MDELLRIVKKYHFTKDDLLEEADCVEDCGEWMHMPLMGYSAKELREVAEKLR